MKSLADKAILSGADNRPLILEKDMYDSWKSIMELYMLNRQHGMMILELVDQGPLLWPTVEEDGVTRLKKYSELSAAEAIQADCDVKAENIILQGLLSEVYALVSTHKVAKELWERIQMLMQGTSLTKQEREYKLYDEFDKFAYRNRETLRDFYLRFSLLLNDMNMYNMKLEQFQVNTKFLNKLPPEWMTDTSSIVNHNAYMASSSAPQIDYALMVQHSSEYSPPETGLVVPVFQKGDDPIDAINHMMSFLTAVVTSRGGIILCQLVRQDRLHQDQEARCRMVQGQSTSSSSPGQWTGFARRRVGISSRSRNGALMANLSHYGFDNLAEVNNQDNKTNHLIPQEMHVPLTSEQSTILNQSNTKIISDSNIISYSQYMNESQYNTIQNSTLPALQDDLILSVIEQLKTQVVNYTKINQDNKQVNELLTVELERYINQERVLNELKHDDKASTSCEPSLEIESLKHTLSEHLKEKESLEQNITILKNDFQKEKSINIDRELALEKQFFIITPHDRPLVFKIHAAVVIPDTEETLMLAEESCSKMIEKQNDPKMFEKKVITKPIDYAIINQLSTDFETRFVPQTELSAEQAFWFQYSVQTDKPNLSATTTIVEVPKELPKVSMRNTVSSPESASTFAELFEINDLKAQAQAKDTVILKLKEKLCSLNGDVNERNVKREVEEIETLNIELDHKSAEVSDLNASLQEKVLVITALKEQLNKLKGKA
nr:hypothetical protein [Tanacetum cinerariifolium]